MELFAFGMFAGIIVAVLLIMASRIIGVDNDDKNVDKRQLHRDSSNDSRDSNDARGDRSVDNPWNRYSKGTEEYEEKIENLIMVLYTLSSNGLLCRTEKEAIQDAISYIETQEKI